jgi:multisubunit Na+/H+ antiporter MnhE subunit
VQQASRDARNPRAWVEAAAAGLEILWWWAAAVATWALTLSSVSHPELIAAAACGLPSALAARAGRKAVGGSWRPRWRWAWWILPLAAAVPADAARLLAVTARRLISRESLGELREIRMPAGEPDDVAAARHAMAVLTISASPGTFVADSNPEEDKIVIHTLISGRPSLEQVVRR